MEARAPLKVDRDPCSRSDSRAGSERDQSLPPRTHVVPSGYGWNASAPAAVADADACDAPTRHVTSAIVKPLAAKILARPRLCARLGDTIPEAATAHMSCFNVSALERTLAVRLGIPIYGCDRHPPHTIFAPESTPLITIP
jgi:hypothetical protein